MSSHALVAYVIRIKKRNEDGFLPVGDFDGSGGDLLVEFARFLRSIKQLTYQDDAAETYLTVDTINHSGRQLQAHLQSGDYGLTSRLFNIVSQQQSYLRQNDDAELVPVFVSVSGPAMADKALLITERYKGRGIKQALWSAFKKGFSILHDGFIIEINPFVPEQAWRKYLEQGSVQRYRLIRHRVPDDIADVFELGNVGEDLGDFEVIVKSRRKHFLAKKVIEEVLSGDRDLSSMLEISGWPDFDEIKVDVRVGKATRTISVQQQKAPTIIYNIEDKVEIDQATSWRTTSSIEGASDSLIADLLDDLNWSQIPSDDEWFKTDTEITWPGVENKKAGEV